MTEIEIEIRKELHFEHEQKFHTKAEVLFPGGEESINTTQSSIICKPIAKLINIDDSFPFQPKFLQKMLGYII